MLKLNQVKQHTRKIVSNPIKCVRKFLGKLTPSKLESSPTADTLIKVNKENYILGSNPLKTIQEITKKTTDAFGKDGMVFSIPDQPDFVLRVEKTALEKIPALSEDMRLIPIKHSDNILQRDNLGLPLYSVIGKNSPLYGRKFLTPVEALAQKDNIMVLRRVQGNHPMHETFEALMDLSGVNEHSVPRYLELKRFLIARQKYNIQGAKKCLDMLKEGKNTIPKDVLDIKKGSDELRFDDPAAFVRDYRKYVDTYLKELKQIASLPKESFQEAVDTILADKNFLIDFQHTNNTFVDLKNKRFNFMDFEYDKNNAKYIYENPIKEFRNVLLGKNFSRDVKNPASFLVEENDIAMFRDYYKTITEKINSVTPQEYQVPFKNNLNNPPQKRINQA